MRFTTRDLLWLTLVMAVMAGWLASYRSWLKRESALTKRFNLVDAEKQELNHYWDECPGGVGKRGRVVAAGEVVSLSSAPPQRMRPVQPFLPLPARRARRPANRLRKLSNSFPKQRRVFRHEDLADLIWG